MKRADEATGEAIILIMLRSTRDTRDRPDSNRFTSEKGIFCRAARGQFCNRARLRSGPSGLCPEIFRRDPGAMHATTLAHWNMQARDGPLVDFAR
jgi:hypothetical protein